MVPKKDHSAIFSLSSVCRSVVCLFVFFIIIRVRIFTFSPRTYVFFFT